ncbi:MAG: ATP-dependent Clp protease adaptor ClpS [Muribaculaceae bacterium]
MAQTNENVREKRKITMREPDMYRVMMHNDDFTSMDFVVMVLRQVFFKNESEATTLMLTIHKNGSAIVGIYPYDIAVSKVKKATRMARENGFPLKITIEQE